LTRARASLTALAAAWPLLAHAAAPRVGEHDGFSRLVFTVPAGVAESVTQEQATLVLHLPGAGQVSETTKLPRGLAGFSGGKDVARLILAPGARPHVWHSPGRVVVDIYTTATPPASARPPVTPTAAITQRGKPAAKPTEAGSVPKPGQPQPPPAPQKLEIRLVAMPDPAGAAKPALAAPAPQANAPLTAPTAPVQTAALPPPAASAAAAPMAEAQAAPEGTIATDGLAVTRVPTAPAGAEAALLLPFDPGVGAAAFSRGGLAHLVFDDSKPLDLAALKDDPFFASARVHVLPAATEVTLKLAPGRALRLQRRPEGWQAAITATASPGDSAGLALRDGAVTIAMPDAAETVVLTDPATGGRLLVGTVKQPDRPVAVAHVSPEFRLAPSWAGVVLDAVSDRLALRAGKQGFTLLAASGPKLDSVAGSAAEQAMADAGTLTRSFDLPPLPVPELLARLRTTLAGAGAAPKLGRFAPRLRAAQDMLALGLGREAAAVLRAALADDPSQATNARANALLSAADYLAGLQETPDPTVPPRPGLSGTDEAALWHAIMAPPATSPAQTAATLASTWRLLLAYPAPLRERLLPVVAQAMLQGGQSDAARALLAKAPDPSLDLTRAELLRQDGKTADALALLDKVAGSLDRRQAALAARAAIEARLASGQLTAAQAADALQQRLYAWRDDTIESETRLRVAALLSQAGKWRDALVMLRGSDSLFPARHGEFRAAERDVTARLLRAESGARMPPLDLVSLVEENADLLAEKEASATIAPVLVDKLLALDLPERAEPILTKLMNTTTEPKPKAALGLRLAGLALDRGDTAMAAADLDASTATDLPAELAESRAVLRARALAASGHPDDALSLLAALHGAAALEQQARLLELQKAWPRAQAALQTLADTTLPATGSLSTPQQELVLRLASAASQAGDMAAMQRLQAGLATRLDPGPRQDLFAALAAQPVTAVSDLPRAAQEAEKSRALPAALASFEPH
jgi:hypothetical protein